MGQMLFLSPSEQHQSTEGNTTLKRSYSHQTDNYRCFCCRVIQSNVYEFLPTHAVGRISTGSGAENCCRNCM